MVATALRLDFGSAGVKEMGSSQEQYLRLGRLEAIKSACALHPRDTEIQNSSYPMLGESLKGVRRTLH